MRISRRQALALPVLAALARGATLAQSQPYGLPRVSLPDFPVGNAPGGLGAAWARLLATATLLDVTPEGELTGGLSLGWTLSTARNALDFSIRFDALFSDATPITPADVVASIERARQVNAGTSEAWRWEHLDKVTLADSSTVRVTLNQPDASVPALFASSLVPIFPETWARNGWNATSGPFPPGSGCFAVDYQSDTRIRLTRNPGFYQVGRPSLAGVLCNAPVDSLSRTTDLVSNGVDLLIDVPLLDIPTLREDDRITLIGGPTNRLCYLSTNPHGTLLADIRLRRLLSTAIDRAALVASATAGEAVPASTLIPPSHWAGLDYTVDLATPDEVRQQLTTLGEPPAPSLRLIASSHDPMLANACVVLQEQLAWSGLAITLNLLDDAEMADARESGQWDIEMAFTRNWIDPHELVRPLMMSDGIDNRSRYANSRVDYLATLASRSTGPTYRSGFYRTIQQIVANDVPVIPLFFPHYYDATSARITAYPRYPPGSAMPMRSATMSPPDPPQR